MGPPSSELPLEDVRTDGAPPARCLHPESMPRQVWGAVELEGIPPGGLPNPMSISASAVAFHSFRRGQPRGYERPDGAAAWLRTASGGTTDVSFDLDYLGTATFEGGWAPDWSRHARAFFVLLGSDRQGGSGTLGGLVTSQPSGEGVLHPHRDAALCWHEGARIAERGM